MGTWLHKSLQLCRGDLCVADLHLVLSLQEHWKCLLVMGVCSCPSKQELLSKHVTCKVIHNAQRKSSAA